MFAETTVERGHVTHGNDGSAYVRFYKRHEKGVSKDFVEIMFPGDTKTIVNRQVKDDDKMRWTQQWRAYEAGEAFKAEGCPLEQWPAVAQDEGLIRDLNHKHIYTVEQLAAVSDQNLANIGIGARELVAKANAFLDVRKDTQAAEKYAQLAEQSQAENKLLREQVADLAKRLQEVEDAKEDKRKRSAKEAA
jgi:transglutaminase-like putative cysteine protease